VDKQGHEIVRKIPGRLKFTDITLKRGITSDMQIWDWRDQAVNGDVAGARKNCTITMLDRGYNPVAMWHFYNAWPSKVTGPSLKSDSNEIGVEELTIVHEGMYREK
jgi:phage tail-like protein